MRYQGSAVANEEYIERGYALPQERPSFEVVSGGGLDARARRGDDPAVKEPVLFHFNVPRGQAARLESAPGAGRAGRRAPYR